ncbi:hypothetical protein SAMN05444673_0457 [Bacillus sp. OV166]|uniref:hypothetical protein n=1 Tax=Bacillus sp. OV166 TaxID=1882763 RepID=UPI000A2AA693|nr:hypothetical protein [Bacillus sp. OV166]SMQ61034.1 hypothetical protein SAMN05444673_0457 [Bacillus sp. OV166]
MKKNDFSNVWKYLINYLSNDQKKEFIKEKDLKIGNMQPRLLTNESQWKVALKLLEKNCTQIKIKNAISVYFGKHIVPELLEDMEDEKKLEYFDELMDMPIENFKEVIEENGYIYVLMFFVLKNNLQKANEIIENIQDEMVKEEVNEDISKDLREKLELAKKENYNLTKKNKNLIDKIEKQKATLQEVEKKNKELLDQQKEIIKEYDKELKILMKQIDEHKNEILVLTTEKENQELNLDIKQKQVSMLEVEKKQLQEEVQRIPEHITLELKESFKKASSVNVLVFGDLPFTTTRQNEKYKFSYFDGDYSNYDFNDSYDEYWYVVDKLSVREKRQLEKNEHAQKIDWVKKTYYGEMNKKQKSEEFAL